MRVPNSIKSTQMSHENRQNHAKSPRTIWPIMILYNLDVFRKDENHLFRSYKPGLKSSLWTFLVKSSGWSCIYRFTIFLVAHSASKVIDTKYYIHQKGAATRVDQDIWLAFIERSINLQIFKKKQIIIIIKVFYIKKAYHWRKNSCKCMEY